MLVCERVPGKKEESANVLYTGTATGTLGLSSYHVFSGGAAKVRSMAKDSRQRGASWS